MLAYCQSTNPAGLPLAWKTPVFALRLGRALPPGVARQRMLAAARAAAAVWNGVRCASVAIKVEDAPRRALAIERDGVNALVPHLVTWCADERGRGCHDPVNPALTTVRFPPSGGPESGAIGEVDVELNAVNYRWDDLSAPNGADLQAVLTHELGHALGLADACRMPGAQALLENDGRPAPDCLASPPEVRASVMWPLAAPNDVRRRALSAEDRRAVCALYPRKEQR